MHFGIGLTRDVAIKVRLRDAALVKLLHTFAGLLAKLVDRAEVDGLGWTCLGAGRLQTVALAIIAERAFVGMAAHFAARDDAERAGRYAARATVADVSLYINVLELILNNGARRASLVARGRKAMLAMVAHHEPAVKIRLVQYRALGSKLAGRFDGELLDEFHMAPGGRRQLSRIVIAVAGKFKAIGMLS